MATHAPCRSRGDLSGVLIDAAVERKTYMIDEKLLPAHGLGAAVGGAAHGAAPLDQLGTKRVHGPIRRCSSTTPTSCCAWVGTLVGGGLTFYLFVTTQLFRHGIGASDWYAWVVLGAWYVGLLLLLLLSLWGALRAASTAR